MNITIPLNSRFFVNKYLTEECGVTETFTEALFGLLKFYEEKNKNPRAYHNYYHMLDVAKICGLIMDNLDDVSQDKKLNVMLAALMHDLGHTGGASPDKINVLNSVKISKLILNALGMCNRISDIEELILSTEFKGLDDKSFIGIRLGQDILHDADYLYATMSLNPTVIMVDLMSEVSKIKNEKLALIGMLERQYEFSEKVRMLTKPGKVLWDAFQPEFIKELEEYVKKRTQE